MLIMMRALTQAERELDRVKEPRRNWASVRRGTLSREVSESVHAKTDERRHLGSISSQSEQVRHLGRSISSTELRLYPKSVMRSCWSCNTDGENLGCSWADYDPSHLQRCWLRTPDSITSDRIWSRYQNERLLNQRNSPPGKYDPRCQSSKKRQIDDKNWLRELLQADYNAAASWL